MAEVKHFDYERFFEFSDDLFCVANSKGYFLRVNEAFSNSLGYSEEHLLARSFLDFVHPADIERTQDELKSVDQGVASMGFVNRYRHARGHYLTFIWHSQIDPEDGLIYAIARDVSDEINRRNKLEQIEQALSEESIIAVTDRRGIITEVNENFCKISGFSREELVGRSHRVVNSGTHPKSFFVDMWTTISKGKIWSGVIENRKKNGGEYTVQTIIIPLIDHEQRVSSYLAIRQDITGNIRTATDLAKTLDILNETSSIAKVGGWELEVATGELTWTDETFRILEVEKKSGQKPTLPEGLQLFTEEGQVIIEQAVQRAIEFGEPYGLEVEAQTARGNTLWVYTSGKPNYEKGQVVSLSGTIQDIDVRKQAEISYGLERQKAIQSAKLASLGELAASMAHEINNPLGIISGYAELMQKTAAGDEQTTSRLGVVLKSCKRISHIVGNLKKFSREDSEHQRDELVLSNIVREAIFLARPRLKRELVSLDFEENTHAKIVCNEIEVEQIVLNLINNSIDALESLPDKWIKLSISVEQDTVEFRIVDSGRGIPVDLQSRIFSPFYTSKKPGEGTGLGLSIVDGILEAHDSSIEYDQTRENTSFLVKFPKAGRESDDN